jgi:hypothetical protein
MGKNEMAYKMKTTKLGLAAGAFLLLCGGINSAAAETGDGWQYEVILYGWYAGVDGEVNYPGPLPGANIAVDAADIIEDLNMAFMGGFQARKNRWSLVADLMYMDVGDEVTRTLAVGPGVPAEAALEMDLTTWLVSGGVGYDLVQADRVTLTMIGGARYLAADVDVKMGVNGPLPFASPARERSEAADLLDGIVGLRGTVKIGGNWYLPYHVDIGAGGSDLSWQAFAGIGYQFGWGNVRLGYRYLSYDLDDDNLLQELQLSGPLLGIGFRF